MPRRLAAGPVEWVRVRVVGGEMRSEGLVTIGEEREAGQDGF